jgi:hypothetical protein
LDGFRPAVTSVKGLSNKRRIPRMGKLRLGFKIKNGSNEFPAELPFFLLPDEVARHFGSKEPDKMVDRATEMGVTRPDVLKFIKNNAHRLAEEVNVMVPLEDEASIFPHSYKFYGKQKGIKCAGNGEMAFEYDEKSRNMQERACPCDKLKTQEKAGPCTLRGSLMVMIPMVTAGGIYQIDVGSYNSVIDVNSGLAFVRSLVGRIAMVPLLLRRVPMETHHGNQKQIHYTLQLCLHPTVGIEALNKLRENTMKVLETSKTLAIEAPKEVNPEFDEETVIVVPAEESGTPPETSEEGDPSDPSSQPPPVEPEGAESEDEAVKLEVIDLIRTSRGKLSKAAYDKIRKPYNPTLSEETIENLKKLVEELKQVVKI